MNQQEEQRNQVDEQVTAAINTLTAIARTGTAGQRADFAGTLSGILSSVAANVGGIDSLLSGRSGSWEAAALRELVTPDDGDQAALAPYRTVPVIVRVNVTQHLGWNTNHSDMWEDTNQIELRWTDLPYPGTDEAEERYMADMEAEIDKCENFYRETYAAYGAALSEAIKKAAAENYPGLTVPVEVQLLDDPSAGTEDPGWIENPVPWGGDDLEYELWERAIAAVPEPTKWKDSDANPQNQKNQKNQTAE